MNKKLLFVFFISFFLSFNIFSNSITDSGKNNLFYLTQLNLKETNAANKLPDFGKIDSNLKISHAVFAGITYASLWALDIVGVFLLYQAFVNPDYQYYDSLKFSHIGISVSALLTFSAVVILAFTKLGLKIKNGFDIRKTHLAAAAVTLSFYVLELTSIILSAVFFANNYENAKWVGLAHGITCAATTLAFSVSFVTIFF